MDTNRLILDVESLKQYCLDNSAVPDDENKAYVAFWHIEGHSMETLRLVIIWTSRKLANRSVFVLVFYLYHLHIRISEKLAQEDGM